MDPKKKLRLKALLAMGTGLSDAEKTELQNLQADAKAANYDPAAPGIGDDEISELVAQGLARQLEASGLSTEAIVDKVKAAISGDNITVEAITKAVQGILPSTPAPVDFKALAEEVKKAIPVGVSETRLNEILTEFGKNFRLGSKMEHEGSGIYDFPIAHRLGNLPVCQKQLLNVMLTKNADRINEGITAEQLATAERRGAQLEKSVRMDILTGRKALTAAGAGTGLELMDVSISSDVLSRLYMESQLAQAMIASEIDMPTSPYKLPMTTTRPTFKKKSEGNAAVASTPGTSQPILDAKKLIGLVEYTYEADEDSIVPVLPVIQKGLGEGAADALECALINGDTTGTHMDSDIETDADHAGRLFKGFRKYALAVAALKKDISSGGVSAANVKALRKVLKKYGMKPSDLMLLVGTGAYNELVALDEVLTLDKVGARAGILTGLAPNIYGIPIIPSSQMREDVNASGVYDGSTTTKGVMILVHKPSFILGVKRGFMLEVDSDKKAQLNYVVASFRRDFIPKETPSATEPMVACGYNFTP